MAKTVGRCTRSPRRSGRWASSSGWIPTWPRGVSCSMAPTRSSPSWHGWRAPTPRGWSGIRRGWRRSNAGGTCSSGCSRNTAVSWRRCWQRTRARRRNSNCWIPRMPISVPSAARRSAAEAALASGGGLLGQKRAQAAGRLGRAVGRLLPKLGLSGGKFEVELVSLSDSRGRDGAEAVGFSGAAQCGARRAADPEGGVWWGAVPPDAGAGGGGGAARPHPDLRVRRDRPGHRRGGGRPGG